MRIRLHPCRHAERLPEVRHHTDSESAAVLLREARHDHTILGGHVFGEYWAEIIQVIATAMTASLTVEQVAVIPFAFPTFTEAVGMAAQMICRDLGIGRFPRVWSLLEPAS